MRLIAPLVCAVVLAACGAEDASGPSGAAGGQLADLTIRVDQDGAKGKAPAAVLELNCAQPTDSTACGAAAGVSEADLAPTPGATACTQVFGGPETATIRGTLRGQKVDARYSRSDGCEISRWQKVQDLLAEVR